MLSTHVGSSGSDLLGGCNSAAILTEVSIIRIGSGRQLLMAHTGIELEGVLLLLEEEDEEDEVVWRIVSSRFAKILKLQPTVVVTNGDEEEDDEDEEDEDEVLVVYRLLVSDLGKSRECNTLSSSNSSSSRERQSLISGILKGATHRASCAKS